MWTGKTQATRDAYGVKLVELGEKNPNIVVLDADLSVSTKTSLFAKRFPERFFDMGIAEQDMISTAAGLAASGKIAFASTFAVFGSGRAWDQVRMCCAYTKLNVKIVVTHGGITTGEDGASHQANEDIAIMRVLPNMTVIVPSDAIETGKAIEAAANFNGPMYIRLSRLATPIINEDSKYNFKIGKGKVMQEGRHVSIFSCGIMLWAALEASKKLKNKGISCEVINIHTIKPIDTALIIKSAKKTGAVVTIEEHSIIGGLGSAISEVLSENCPVPLKRVGIKDTFGESGKPLDLLIKYGLAPSDIVAACKNVLARKK